MRIGISLKSHDPEWGGPGTYTIEVVKHLLQLDREDEYVLIYPASDGPKKYLGQYREYDNVTEIEARIPRGLLYDLVVIPKLANHWHVDVLFSPFMALPMWGHFKKVMTVHGAERYMVPGMLTWEQYSRWLLMEKLMLPKADKVIAVSNTMKQDFCRALRYPIDKVCTTYLGVSEEFTIIEDQERLADTRKRYGLTEDFILFVGNLFPNKNFGNLLKAFRLIAAKIPHSLAVVGGRRWKYQADLALVDTLGLQARVKFLHFVSKDDLVSLYNLATCFVFPSLYESFGLAQLEAMACGCPVVVSRTGALPEVAGDAALFCDPHNPKGIAETLLKLINDIELQQVYRQKGLTHAKKFSWPRCAAETLRVLREVVLS